VSRIAIPADNANGGGYTFSKYELWCRFAGKPIRYAIGDFAVVTGLNCGT
ncbi:unnamed protein product, partial [Brassica oleracea]